MDRHCFIFFLLGSSGIAMLCNQLKVLYIHPLLCFIAIIVNAIAALLVATLLLLKDRSTISKHKLRLRTNGVWLLAGKVILQFCYITFKQPEGYNL